MINKSIILGRIGQEPKTIEKNGEITMCNFSIATSKSWKDKTGEWQEKTQWHSITTYGFAAKKASQFSKGDTVYVEGEIEYNENNGTKYTNIIARELKKIGGQKSAQVQEERDDLPF
jgi:single-strand DNA-binding protein